MQDIRPPCLIFWIGYLACEFADGRRLPRKVRTLLRDIVSRRHERQVRGEEFGDGYELASITEYDGRRIGYGVILGGAVIENLSGELDFCRLWLEELSGPLEDIFDKTVRPCIYVSLGRHAE